ncbi:class I SAM-dependent methyltransferase [Piscirickettsia litoralis]|uniref:Methyltransferase type 11 domain-containing protein n=1 Tax=Piscirickettsia litoralis TaxID=1891921 RepID=A0ABX3A1L6_9GAMM|nr:class I SAM-dependent methyltransferase [Piscirickettsia litoralis]ODN42761.1 hypothetical protein BGC07_07275 [Piscirickettsia litoralis]
MNSASEQDYSYVADTKIGVWFLKTRTWRDQVLRAAIKQLEGLIPEKQPRYHTILDIGCGHGLSFRLLQRRFHPKKIIGLDIETTDMGPQARHAAKTCACTTEILHNHAAKINLADHSVDLIFCHQAFHHIVEQEQALNEFYRLLKPGGLLLFAESTRSYIHSWSIRLFFRHPMHVQRDAAEYIHMIKKAGFKLDQNHTSTPDLWWARSDYGLIHKLFGYKKPLKEPKLLNLVAIKP